jgi:hypothetical protein
MPYLFELLTDKTMIDTKIDEIKSILKYEQNDSLAQELFRLFELKQSKLLYISAANNTSKLNIGENEINITTALIIRKTIKEKIDILTDMINNKDCSLDKMELQKQRDRYYDEYILLSMGIKRNDLTITIS